MTEITELKQYVFAQYIGQKVLMHPQTTGQWFVTGNNLIGEAYAQECYLQLRPLSSIKDEEAIEVVKLQGIDMDKIKSKPDINFDLKEMEVCCYCQHSDWYETVNMKTYQYLQQQGFALPIYFKGEHYSVERLQELGIINIKN